MENNFDELKNQWGWGGFVTKDLLRCQIAARSIALIYNWWSLFVRLADPSKRRESHHQAARYYWGRWGAGPPMPDRLCTILQPMGKRGEFRKCSLARALFSAVC